MAMSKRAALAEAATCVSISGSGTSWRVYSPYRNEDPSGPSTEISCDSYRKAQVIAAKKKAQIALFLMGRWTAEGEYQIEYAANGAWPATTTTRELLDIGLKESTT